MSKYDPKVYEVFKRMAGDKLESILATAENLQETVGKQPERALADALDMYGIHGAVK